MRCDNENCTLKAALQGNMMAASKADHDFLRFNLYTSHGLFALVGLTVNLPEIF